MNVQNPSDEVHGLLKGVSLTNFLQLIEIGGDTCLLEVNHGNSDAAGRLYINDGMLCDAKCGALTGTDAAVQMLKWDQVEIMIHELPDETMHITIDKSLASLIFLAESDDGVSTEASNVSANVSATPNKLKSILEKMTSEMDGLIASAIVSIDDGLQVEQVSKRSDIDSESASAYLAKVVESNREALRLMGWDRQPEDILITTHDSYFIIRQLPGDTFFLFVLTTRDEWIGRTRYQMAAYADELAANLELMQKK